MAYTKTTWEDLPSTNTPITASNLNNIENQVDANTTDIADLTSDIATNTSDIETLQAQTSGTATMGAIIADNLSSKNMFEPTLYVNGTAIVSTHCTASLNDDTYTLTATTNDYCYFSEVGNSGTSYNYNKGPLIPVTPGEKITFSLTNNQFNQNYITAYNSSKVSLGYAGFGSNTGTYTAPSNASYITFRFGVNNVTSGTSYSTKVQIEKSASATSYSRYKAIGYVSGENSNGTYMKFDDGIMICTKKVSGSLGGNLWVNNIYFSDLTIGDWPQTFTSIYSVSLGQMPDTYWGTTNGTSIRVFRPNNGVTTGSVVVTAIGRWK